MRINYFDKQASKYIVWNIKTASEIPFVAFADDESGKYEVVDMATMQRKEFQGNIRIVSRSRLGEQAEAIASMAWNICREEAKKGLLPEGCMRIAQSFLTDHAEKNPKEIVFVQQAARLLQNFISNTINGMAIDKLDTVDFKL